jgi:hypothetical protein
VPLFGKGNKGPAKATPQVAVEGSTVQEYSLKLSYAAKSSDTIRVRSAPGAPARLARMLEGYVHESPELVEPYPVEMNVASPFIHRIPGAVEWLTYHRKRTPITRHTLVVLEATDAIDLAFETLVCGLLDGNVDTSGYPDLSCIVGGVVSHWDEMTGDMLVRAVVGWGGKGVRGDTDRNASRLVAGLFNNILADENSIGIVPVDRPATVNRQGGLICGHCGFDSGTDRAFYCLKCGMKLRN